MVRTLGLGLLFAAGLFAVLLPARAAERETLKIGMLKGMFRDTPPAAVLATAGPFRSVIQKQAGVQGEIELVADYRTLVGRMKEGTCQVGVFHGFEFAWAVKQDPNLVPLVTTLPHGKVCQACLVTHKDGAAMGAKDLKGKCVVVPKGMRAHCHLYLERLRLTLPAGSCEQADHGVLNQEQALDEVVQANQESALVDLTALNSYKSTKPGAFNHLRVVCQSEETPPAVVASYKGQLPPAAAEAVQKGLLKFNQTAEGRTLVLLWNLQGFGEIPADFDAVLEKSRAAFPAPEPTAAKR